MIVCMSRKIAINLYKEILNIRPNYNEKIKVVLTDNNNDPEEWHDIVGNKQYRDNLRIRVETMRKKYNQGRISLSELIQDEDSLFESELMVARTKYNIINLLLDYLSIFNKTECDFNI